jgi:hypothetical protein
VVLPLPRGRAVRALSRPPTGVALSVAALVAVWLVATKHGPFSSIEVNDLFVYGQYKALLDHGLVPYRDFDFEYPPLALPPIAIAGDGETAMSLLMLGCAVAAQLAAWAIGGAGAGWAMVALPVLAGALVRTHVDLLPAALAMIGLALVVRGSPVAGLAVLGLGTMAKLWPAVIALVALAWLAGRGDRRAAVRGALAFGTVVLLIGVPFAVVGGFPEKLVRFHLERPVQIESTAASVLELTGGSYVTGHPVRPDRFKSNGLDGGAADVVGALSALALLAAVAGFAWLAARRPREPSLVLAAFGAALAFVAFGKVLSPQYFCWLLPLAAVAWVHGARAGAALTAAASLLTQVWFPTRYFDLVHQRDTIVAAVAVRNLLLLLAVAATARALARSPRHAAAAPRSG